MSSTAVADALRSGEVLEPRRKDVDIVAGAVRVVRALSSVGGQAIVGTPKSAAATRVVSIPPHVIPAVAHHLETMTAASPDALLFPGRDGVSHLQPSTLHRKWRMAREAAARPDLRVHDLRHTRATMAARGCHPRRTPAASWPQLGLYNATRSLFEQAGFTDIRRRGAHLA